MHIMKKAALLLASLILIAGQLGNSSASFFFIFQPKRPD
jgi:cyclic lactone autoinducer peptide